MSDAAESPWFGQESAFWRWVKMPEAKPYVEAFIAQQTPLKSDEPLHLMGECDDAGLLNADHLRELAHDIETRFGTASH